MRLSLKDPDKIRLMNWFLSGNTYVQHFVLSHKPLTQASKMNTRRFTALPMALLVRYVSNQP